MKTLLSKNDFLELSIIEYLLHNPRTDYLLLSDILQTDVRTIKSSIQKINSKINPISITFDEHHLKINIPRNYSIRYIYATILQNSLEFKIIEFCFFAKEISFIHLENAFFVSNSTLRRKIKKINCVLSNDNIAIDLKSLRLVGDPHAIQNFIIHYIYDAYPSEQSLKDKRGYALIKKAITLYSQAQHIDINELDLHKASVTVWVHFYFQKYIATISDDSTKPILDVMLNHQIKKLFSIQSDVFNFFTTLKNLQKKMVFTTHNQLLNTLQYDTDLQLAYNNFEIIITNIATTFSINAPSNLEKLLVDLCTVYNLNYGKPFVLYDKYGLFVKEMANNHAELTTFLITQFNHYFVDIKDYTVNSLSYILITHWHELLNFIEQNKAKISIGLIYDTDIEHIAMLKNDIAVHLQQHCTITEESVNYFDFPKRLATKYDLIITNIPGITIDNTNILCLPMYPQVSDWLALGMIYQEITQRKLTQI